MNKKLCIYCGGPTHQPFIESVLQCKDCESLVCPDDAPKYEPDYHAYRFSFLRPKLWYLAIKATQCGLGDGLTVCDVGCGAGHALWWAKHLYGCTTVGYDIPAAEKYVRGCDIFFSDPGNLKLAWHDKCDLVWCWHTIEHTDSPLALLMMLQTLVAPTGRIYLEFPDAQATLYRGTRKLRKRLTFPEHRGLPSRKWLVNAAKQLGLRIVKADYPRNANILYGKLRASKEDLLVCLEREK